MEIFLYELQERVRLLYHKLVAFIHDEAHTGTLLFALLDGFIQLPKVAEGLILDFR